jgi:TonB family protein
LVVGLRRLASITARAERLRDGEWTRLVEQASATQSVGRQVAVLETAAPDLLATWGLIAPCVLLPSGARSWTPDRARVVICHELAHIRRRDWVTQMIAEVLLTIYWFNPLMWMTCSRLRRDSEQACDDAVLRAGIPARSYAGHLLDLARLCRRQGSAWAVGTPMARRSTLERRIAAMLKSDLDRRTLSSRAVGLTVALLVAVTLPAGAVRLAQSSPLPLHGTVYDSTGAVLPNVEVTLSTAPLEEGQVPQATSTTDAAGRFEMPSVAPGKYVLQASLPAFRQLRQEFELKTSRDWDRAVTLQVGDVRETITVSASRVAPSVSASARPPQPVRVGGTIRAPMKLVDVRPVYPTSMRVAGLEGVVPIEAIIGRDGTVISLRVLSAQVHPDFAVAAADAVRQWKFAPTLLNGQPVDVAMTVSVTFKLAD